MPNVPLDVGDDLPGIRFVPAPIELLGGKAELVRSSTGKKEEEAMRGAGHMKGHRENYATIPLFTKSTIRTIIDPFGS